MIFYSPFLSGFFLGFSCLFRRELFKQNAGNSKTDFSRSLVQEVDQAERKGVVRQHQNSVLDCWWSDLMECKSSCGHAMVVERKHRETHLGVTESRMGALVIRQVVQCYRWCKQRREETRPQRDREERAETRTSLTCRERNSEGMERDVKQPRKWKGKKSELNLFIF